MNNNQVSKEVLNKVLNGYITCALWAETDADGDPLDGNYTEDDINPGTLSAMEEDVKDFITSNIDLFEKYLEVYPAESFGHDFWLTKNGHGAGFWDRGLGDLGDKLTEQCKPYGESYVYVGDNGQIYSY